jgi:hypothetical protein
MNAEPESTNSAHPEKLTGNEVPRGSFISIPFILIVIVLLAGGYPAGKWVMHKFIFMQENTKATGEPIAPPEDLERTGIGAMGAQSKSRGGGGGRRGAGGGGDPSEVFARQDADENGKLEGDEISERMQGRVDEIDTDGDGAISKDEFIKAMENWRGRRGNDDEAGEKRPETDESDQSDE